MTVEVSERPAFALVKLVGSMALVAAAVYALAGLPSLVLLWWLQARGHFERLAPRKT